MRAKVSAAPRAEVRGREVRRLSSGSQKGLKRGFVITSWCLIAED
jgi:hypothetical protein